MAFRKIRRKDLQSGCSETGPDDGLDPRFDRKTERSPDRPAGPRKGLQLCRQVAQTLSSVLGESEDDVVRDLLVESVELAPSSARLLVTVSPAPSAPPLDPAVILEHLHRAQGQLRSEVAGAVTRRKAPDLIFQVQQSR